MGDQTVYLMMCDACGRLVHVVTSPGSRADTFRVVECLDRTDGCYREECAFTTDGAEIPVSEMQPFLGEGV
jgi:hypothetical protein